MSDVERREVPADARKVFVVFLPVRLPLPGRPNTKVLAVKLTRTAADEVAKHFPGAYVEKFWADREAPDVATIVKLLAA